MREANESKKNGTVLRWCSIREALAPTRRRKFRRIHGLEAPLHPQQVIGWLVILLIAVNTFAVLTPMLDPNLRPILSAVIGGVFLTHLLSHLTVLLLDPADPQVRGQPTNKVIPEFDRRKHSRVIENGRCHLCDILVTGKRTKHCSICNKCVTRFDHHCKWLNNCIGDRNYLAFLTCVISAILSALLVAGLSGTEVLLAVLRDRRSDRPSPSNVTRFEHSLATVPPDPTDPTDQIPGPASLAALSLLGGLSAVVALLLIHLCLFHGYLACLGLTTYEYIREKRQRERTALASNVPPIAASATLSSLPSASTMRIEPTAYVHPRERPVDAESTIPSNPRASSRCFAPVHRLCGNFAGRSCLVRVDPSKEMGQARTNSPIPSEERAEDSLGCVRHMGRSVDAFLGSTDRRRPPSGRLSLPNLSLEVPLRPPKKCSPPDSVRASPSFLSQQSTPAVTKTRRRTARSRSRRTRDFRLSPILEAELSATLDSPQPTGSPSAVGSRSSYRASPGRTDPPEGKSLSA